MAAQRPPDPPRESVAEGASSDLGFGAVVAPYRDITAFEFRVVNNRRNQLANLTATVMMSRFEGEPPNRQRRFYQLPLERSTVAFFPMNWTIVHPIDQASPLWSWDAAQLMAAEAKFAVLLAAVDETFPQTVHGRSSYTVEEVRFGHRFELMYHEDDEQFVLDLDKLSATRPVETRAPAGRPAGE